MGGIYTGAVGGALQRGAPIATLLVAEPMLLGQGYQAFSQSQGGGCVHNGGELWILGAGEPLEQTVRDIPILRSEYRKEFGVWEGRWRIFLIVRLTTLSTTLRAFLRLTAPETYRRNVTKGKY